MLHWNYIVKRLGLIIIGIHSSSKRLMFKIVDKSAPALWGLNLDHTLMYDWDG